MGDANGAFRKKSKWYFIVFNQRYINIFMLHYCCVPIKFSLKILLLISLSISFPRVKLYVSVNFVSSHMLSFMCEFLPYTNTKDLVRKENRVIQDSMNFGMNLFQQYLIGTFLHLFSFKYYWLKTKYIFMKLVSITRSQLHWYLYNVM